jgi:hypothetical protein
MRSSSSVLARVDVSRARRAIRSAGTSVPANRLRESMRDRAHTPNGPALWAPEKSPAVSSLPHELCRRPVTRRAAVRGWLGFAAHEDLHHEAKKRPARPGGGTGQVWRRTAMERRERYRRPGDRDQQIECRAHRNVTASSHRHMTGELSPRARSFVVFVRADADLAAVAAPHTRRLVHAVRDVYVSPALTPVETSMRILAWSKSLRRR